MQGLLITSALSLLLMSACANDKFQEHSTQGSGNAPAVAEESVPPSSDALEKSAEPTTLPAAVSETTDNGQPTQIQKPLFAECDMTSPIRPIVGDLYQLAVDSRMLPDYSKLKAIKKVCLAQLDIKTRSFSDGFPGVEKLFEWFSLDMNFTVNVPKEGKWEFKLVADDGAILYIDQAKVVDNDGVHGTTAKTGRAQLKAGSHKFRVSYFQGPRFNIALELYWKGPQDKDFSYIPAANLSRPVANLN